MPVFTIKNNRKPYLLFVKVAFPVLLKPDRIFQD
jgi:hypothetical protein